MKKFFISRNQDERIDFIKSIEGKKVAIFNKSSDILKHFDVCIDMNQLMNNDYFLENITKCDSTTTLVLVDVLVKNGIYVHPYGKIFRFTEVAKQTIIVDSFIFKFDEKHIVRPFLFIDTSVFGTSMIGFHADESNTVENYAKRVRSYIDCRVNEIECVTIQYKPTQNEKDEYENLKKTLIYDKAEKKNKIVTSLIAYVDSLESKKKVVAKTYDAGAYIIKSNNPKNKFKLYEVLKDEEINKIVFFSSGIFGADEIELQKTKNAIERHNKLISLLKDEKLQ